jgi:hypothetical protein
MKLAWLEPFNVSVSIVVEPSLIWTIPVGVPLPVTLTENVTAWPNADGFGMTLTVVVEASPDTVWVYVAEVLPTKLPSPV